MDGSRFAYLRFNETTRRRVTMSCIEAGDHMSITSTLRTSGGEDERRADLRARWPEKAGARAADSIAPNNITNGRAAFQLRPTASDD